MLLMLIKKVMSMEEFLVGIDFGACNLKAAAFVDGKKFRPIQLNTQEGSTKHAPNIIYYRKNKKDGTINKIIGQAAFVSSLTDIGTEKNFVANIKRKMEIADWSQRIANLDCDVTAFEIIRDIFECIQRFFSNKKSQSVRAVLTVPVCFSEVQRNMIRRAAEESGLVVDTLISEPFAAIFSLRDLPSYKDKLIMIFDFGGSTLDVSISKIECSSEGELKIIELAAAGIRFGGLDIDRDIYEKILLRDFKTLFDNSSIKDAINREDFYLNFTRELKELLFKTSEDAEAQELSEGTITGLEDVILKYKDVEKLFSESNYKKKIFDMFDAIFEDLEDNPSYSYQKEDIARIFPIGGTCKIPFFIDILEEYFGTETFNKEDFDFDDNEFLMKGLTDRYLAVASGAARYLNRKQDGSLPKSSNVIPYCIGYGKDGKFSRCLNRNMPFGYETRSMLLPLPFLKKISWTIQFFQCFSNQTVSKLDSEEGAAVYIGKIKLDESLYEKKESPLFKIRIMRDGRLRLEFFDNKTFSDGSKELVTTEEHFLEIGG